MLSFRVAVFAALSVFAGKIDDYNGRTLLSLLALGRYGAGSLDLSQQFKALGVLHLLVLSGSQVSCFVRVWERLPRFWGWRWGFDQEKINLFRWLGLGLFSGLVPLEAPIVRALLMEALALGMPRLRLEAKIALVMGLQLLIFPEHLLRLGFYLSWICWALLHLSRCLPGKFLGQLVLVLLCQITAILLTGSPAPSPRTWLLLVLGNLLLLNLFESWIFPLTAVVLSLCIFTVPLFLNGMQWPIEPLSEVLAPFLNGGYGLVLVALGGFRYIQ